MSKGFITLLVFSGVVLIFGCPMERTIARPNIRELPHFLFSAPEDDAWVVEKTDEKGTTVFTARRGAAICRITLLENSLLNGSLRQASAKYVANYYRNGEKNDMIERGVKRGLYELSNVTMGQETIDDKLYYTMKYSTESQKHFESARLYVFFPFEYGNDYFLVVHYSEAAPSRELLTFSFESELLRILRTVAHKPARSGEQDRIAHRQAPQGSLMEFFPGAYSVTQLPLPQSALEIRCQKHINKGWKAYVSFIGMKKGPIFLVVFTGKNSKHLEKTSSHSVQEKGYRQEGQEIGAMCLIGIMTEKSIILPFSMGRVPLPQMSRMAIYPTLQNNLRGRS